MEFETSKTKVIRVLNATAVGTTTLTSSTVDTANYEGVRFIAAFGTITDGTPNLQGRQGAASDMSDGATLLGTDVAMADTDDNKLGILEIFRPQERYVDCQIVRGGVTGCVVDGMIAELYGPRVMPVTKDSTVGAQETHASPAEGTP